MERLRLTNPLGGPLYYTDQTGSTMDDLLRMAGEGSPIGTVLMAGHQTRGRGRRASELRWNDVPGRNLLLSVLLECPVAQRGSLPLRLGVAVAEALELHCRLSAEVKWPNDLLVEGGKLAGILCEGHQRFVVCGIGVNCNQLTFPSGLPVDATSIAAHTGRRVRLKPLLREVLRQVARWEHAAGWLQRVNRRLAWRGQLATVQIEDGQAAPQVLARGVVERVDELGQLVVGGRAVSAGTLRLVPQTRPTVS